MPSPRSIAVLIPTYRRPDSLGRALLGVALQTRQADEVVVVARRDDHASVALVERAEPERRARVVLVDVPGVVAARNAGLSVVASDVVAFLDDDAVPRPDWLELLLAHYVDATVGAVGGRDVVHHAGIPVEEGPRGIDVGRLTWYGRLVGLHHRGTGASRDVDYVKGVNMSFRRGYFPDIRADTMLWGTGAQPGEELSVCLEIKRRGYRVIYDPAILVDHYESDRADAPARQSPEFAPRRDGHHNETYLVAKYFRSHRVAVHLLYGALIGTGKAPGLVASVRNVLLTRTLAGHRVPLWANWRGRAAGVRTAVRAGRTPRPRS